MLKRKIEDTLKAWKEEAGHKPLVVKGCRQCGKTFSVRKFAKDNYANTVYLNFIEEPHYMLAFEGSKKVDDITMNITAMMPDAVFEEGKTCLVLDEVQDCPAARSALKFFQIDGRYDVIATGSLLGVKGYGEGKGYSSVPVGYETHLNMYPLDFEEFLWACGMTQEIISRIRACLDTEQPVPEALHQRFRQLLLQYTVVGGMPDIVSLFVDSRDMGKVLAGQRSIVASYEEDMIKYAPDRDKPRIRECFESIPRQLGKENKKFQYSLIRKGAKASQYAGSIQWIEDAGIVCRCRNLNITELPLDGNAMEDVFKMYMVDTGLFISMLEDGTQFDILQGKLYGYKGAIFENLIADIFAKMGRRLYYFRKDSGLEVDFVMRYQGECVLVEVKAQSGNVKSSKTILAHPEKYHVNRLVKLGDYNVCRQEKMLVLPLYMAFLLREL
ncbi:MAG: ATP-binding protein [Prevotella sp.]|nr:ATP-binding protein [Prevotella sp.]